MTAMLRLPNSRAVLFIDDDNKAYYEEVLAKADEIGLEEQLQNQLKFLAEYGCWREDGTPGNFNQTRCELYKDFAPLSFGFVMKKLGKDRDYQFFFNGGLLFHGNHDGHGSGAFPTLAVTLTKTTGWSVHT